MNSSRKACFIRFLVLMIFGFALGISETEFSQAELLATLAILEIIIATCPFLD